MLSFLSVVPDNHFDSIVSDPPYGLSFMGKEWDHGVPGKEFWIEALRVAKPGAYLVAFGGTRTYHRLTCAIEDAGWEIRDCLSWLYGSGFPKSHNGPWGGTALKPAWEPIILARKPLIGTVAANVVAHGTGGLSIDGCRIGTEARHNPPVGAHRNAMMPYEGKDGPGTDVIGRWPANVCLDEEVGAMLGEPSRFFYCAKASRSEREAGLEGCEVRTADPYGEHRGRRMEEKTRIDGKPAKTSADHHPTVKPISLMRWLCRLVTPSGGLILDPFMGSGTTGCAAVAEGFRFLGVDKEAEYVEIARRRIEHWASKKEGDALTNQ